MNPKNPYENRWRWWYSAIADWMIANPDKTLTQCAKDLGKAMNTISLIVNTDLFKDYLRVRKSEWEQRHDFALRAKTVKVAELSLDVLSEALEKKRDAVPIGQLTTIATSALDRLGYSPNKPAPTTQVNIQANGQAQVAVMPVNSDALQEAREAIRLSQARRAAQATLPASSVGVLPDASSLDLAAERLEPDDTDVVRAAVDVIPPLGSNN